MVNIIVIMEEYRLIFENEDYEVSNLGNVRNNKTGKILKSHVGTTGYYGLQLYLSTGRKMFKVHRLVAIAFLPNQEENRTCVDHIDNNRLNNNLANLRWATHQENSRNMKLNSKNLLGVKGVYFSKTKKKYISEIKIDGIKTYIGSFENLEDAKKARINKVNEIFGNFKNVCEN